jgi:hypothetical protein
MQDFPSLTGSLAGNYFFGAGNENFCCRNYVQKLDLHRRPT